LKRAQVGDRVVLAGPASEDLAKSVASQLGLGLLKHEFKVFPDGESKFTVQEKVSDRVVIFVQSTYPPIDQHLMQFFLASRHLSQDGARVVAVIPYLAYARQDKPFLPGEVVSLSVVASLLRSVGVARLVTVDIHSSEGLGLFPFPSYSVSGIPALAAHARSMKLKDPVVVAPDFGSSKRAEAFASLYGAGYLQLQKTRDRMTGDVKVQGSFLEVKGKEVLIVDDMISTGGTVKAAAELVLDRGAKEAIALCVHGLFVGDALAKLEKAGVKRVVGCNTIPGKSNVVDVSEAIASHLKTIDE
jgi:ribose-phosphate pyrophosphokinase